MAGFGIDEVIGLCTLGTVGAVFYFAGRKGISAALSARSSDTRKQLESSKIALAEIEKKIAKAQGDLSQIELRKSEIIANAEKEARAMGEAMILDAKQTSERIISDSKAATETEVENFKHIIKKELVENTFQKTLDSLTGSEGDKNLKGIHDGLINKFVNELPSKYKKSIGKGA